MFWKVVKKYINSDWVSEVFGAKCIFNWIYVILAFKPYVFVFFIPAFHSKWSLKPLSLCDLSLRYYFLLENHGSFDNKQLFALFLVLSVRTMRRSLPRINVINGDIKFLMWVWFFLAGRLSLSRGFIMITIFSFGNNKTSPQRHSAWNWLIPLLSTTFSRNGDREAVCTFPHIHVYLRVYCFVSFDQFIQKFKLMSFLVGLIIGVIL